jgi:endonuclease/exonuclease/phosphatase (EEP) superfamily protein YafD
LAWAEPAVMNARCANRLALWLVATLIACSSYVQANPASSPAQPNSAANAVRRNPLTVAFWNIEWFPGQRPNPSQRDEINQVQAVHRDMVTLQADIIGMEEVRDFYRASLAIKPLPGFKVDVCSNFPPREGQVETQQVAIASRLQPVSAWAEMWKPQGAMLPPRGFAFAAYQVAPGQMLLVYALHLKSNRGELQENISMREESIRQLLSHMKAMDEAYKQLGTLSWIVGGDFNTSPDDKRFAEEKTSRELFSNGLSWTWKDVPFAQRHTVPPDERYPAACFDHIFYRGLTLRRAWMANTSPRSSDHRAVQATFDLAPAR